MSLISIISGSDRSVPGAPTIGTATNVGTGRAFNNGAATVTFSAPAYTGRTPITGYTVTSSPGGFTATGAGSPLTVTGLASATAYTFTVTATNAVGTSAASAASNSITATTVPQAPTIGTATAGDTTASITFTNNANGGSAITGNTMTSSPGSITGTGTSPITVSGLTNGTAYTFTATATNANGTSAASAASNSVTPALGFAYNSIASFLTTANQSLSTVSFSSIPQTYSALEFRLNVSSSDITLDSLFIRVNGSGTNLYNFHELQMNGAGPVFADGYNQNQFSSGVEFITGTATPNTNFAISNIIMTVYDYASSSKTKTIRIIHGTYNINNNRIFTTRDLIWNSTAPITSMVWASNQGDTAAGRTFALYGIS